MGYREKRKPKANKSQVAKVAASQPKIYTVEFYPDALAALEQIPQSTRNALVEKIKGLANDPRPHGSQELKGWKGYYRIRQGNYRAIYTVDDRIVRVVVVKVGDRKAIYSNLQTLK